MRRSRDERGKGEGCSESDVEGIALIWIGVSLCRSVVPVLARCGTFRLDGPYQRTFNDFDSEGRLHFPEYLDHGGYDRNP